MYQQVPEGNGSGVIWDTQGHIVTNYHGKGWLRSLWLLFNVFWISMLMLLLYVDIDVKFTN